jgi:hypothetical protein
MDYGTDMAFWSGFMFIMVLSAIVIVFLGKVDEHED